MFQFFVVSVPAMILLGVYHAMDVDHITAIDSLVRLHNAVKRSRWIGTVFSAGHMISVLTEMVFIIYVIGDIASPSSLTFFGVVGGAIMLGTIGAVNIYSMRRWNKSSPAILANKILKRSKVLGPNGSAFVTGSIFGLGFDTATQISAIALSAMASATAGIHVALLLAGIFALGMITIDTFNSMILRSIFSRILHTSGFRYVSYLLSACALAVATIVSYEAFTKSYVLPTLTGPILAVAIISSSFTYSLAVKGKR